MDGFNWLGWKQPQTQQVLAADTGVGPAKMGILRDAKNREQHLEEFGFKQLKTLMIIAYQIIAWFGSWGCRCHQVF